MKNRLCLVVSLLLVTALVANGCATKTIKPLTDTEKDRFVEIALNHPEVSKWLETASVYETEVGWSAIGWKDSKAVEWHRLAYEDIADGNLPSGTAYLAPVVTIHPDVYLRIGEPVRLHIHVAFDREAEKVVNVELMPGR
jgi:hypothetical protein